MTLHADGRDNVVYVVERYEFGGWRPWYFCVEETAAQTMIEKIRSQRVIGCYDFRVVPYRPSRP